MNIYSKLRFITAKGKVQTQQEKDIHKQTPEKSSRSSIFRDDPHSFSPVVNLQGPVKAVVSFKYADNLVHSDPLLHVHRIAS